MALDEWIMGLAQGLVLIAAAPVLVGVLRWLRARMQFRQGPPVLQVYRDLAKLLRRPAVRPAHASFVFGFAPYALFGVYGTLVFMLPVISPFTLLQGDLILIIMLLGLGRFVLSLAGLDTGAGFGGLGASREMFLHFLTEIGLVFVLIALAADFAVTGLPGLFEKLAEYRWLELIVKPELMLLGVAMFLMILLDAERLPVDNPATHLELTMAQRAIALEFTGRDLAILDWAEFVKLAALLTLAGRIFLPLPHLFHPEAMHPGLLAVAVIGYLVRIALLLAILAAVESSQPKRRLRDVPRLTLTSMALSAMSILFTLTLGALQKG